MHEYSIVEGIMEAVVPLAMDSGAERISVVRLRIGEMSEIVPEAMDLAWEVACDERAPLTSGCKLQVERVQPRSTCVSCGLEYDHDRLHPRCPACGSGQTLLLRGRELEIVSFDIETPDDDEDAASMDSTDNG